MQSPPPILVHACCAACSSWVVELLARSYRPTALFYNPNIHPEDEYLLRLEDMRSVCRSLGVELLEGARDTDAWIERTTPWAHLPERSERCAACFRLRLDETARTARELGIGIFTTTLSVSPHKIHAMVVEAGNAAAERYGVEFLARDFKKQDGFRISCERSRRLGLRRQDYCGCPQSLEEARRRRIQRRPGHGRP